jgi:hypothetical protein
MPKNLRADIEWHKARIAFYSQALEETKSAEDMPDKADRVEGLTAIIADLRRTMNDLEKALAQRT